MALAPVLAPSGELSDAPLRAFERQVLPYLDASGPGLVLDLALVSYVDSTGLGLFVRVGKTLEEQGRVLVLARLSRSLDRMIRTLGLDAVFPLFRTVAEAQAWVAQRSVGEL
jgi:anti-anti-sigma factor